MHGDLTCRNILLNADYTVAKIGDLGLAKVMQATITDANAGGTLAFAAPELLLNMRCNEKVSFALSAWETVPLVCSTKEISCTTMHSGQCLGLNKEGQGLEIMLQ